MATCVYRESHPIRLSSLEYAGLPAEGWIPVPIPPPRFLQACDRGGGYAIFKTPCCDLFGCDQRHHCGGGGPRQPRGPPDRIGHLFRREMSIVFLGNASVGMPELWRATTAIGTACMARIELWVCRSTWMPTGGVILSIAPVQKNQLGQLSVGIGVGISWIGHQKKQIITIRCLITVAPPLGTILPDNYTCSALR
jgi:hypothetical protein